jgi:CTP:molybdopterin cytidylyltransferase MocA
VIAAVVLAAGEGRRYGGLKQLHPVGGRPMLEHVLATVAGAGPEHRVVVLGARAGTILERIDLHGAQPVISDRWDAGQAASDWAIVVLGDGPDLDARAVGRVTAAAKAGGTDILAADYGAGRSHPVAIPRARWTEIPASGERPVRGLPAEAVDCRDLTPPGDVDYA